MRFKKKKTKTLPCFYSLNMKASGGGGGGGEDEGGEMENAYSFL